MDSLKWRTDYNVSKRHMSKLNAFYTAQLELCLGLQRAKPLGTCKTTTLVPTKFDSRSLDSILKNGKKTITTNTILSNGSLKEMSS